MYIHTYIHTSIRQLKKTKKQSKSAPAQSQPLSTDALDEESQGRFRQDLITLRAYIDVNDIAGSRQKKLDQVRDIEATKKEMLVCIYVCMFVHVPCE